MQLGILVLKSQRNTSSYYIIMEDKTVLSNLDIIEKVFLGRRRYHVGTHFKVKINNIKSTLMGNVLSSVFRL